MSTEIKDYGYTRAEINDNSAFIPARVIERRREIFKVVCEHGETGAELKGSFYNALTDEDEFPAVGDFVLIQYNSQGNSLITKLLLSCFPLCFA